MTGSMNHGPNLLSYSTLLTKLEKELGFMSRSSLSLYKLTLNCNFSYLLSVVDCQLLLLLLLIVSCCCQCRLSIVVSELSWLVNNIRCVTNIHCLNVSGQASHAQEALVV